MGQNGFFCGTCFLCQNTLTFTLPVNDLSFSIYHLNCNHSLIYHISLSFIQVVTRETLSATSTLSFLDVRVLGDTAQFKEVGYSESQLFTYSHYNRVVRMESLSSHGPSLSPNYSFTFKFEQGFDYHQKREWMAENWWTAFYWVNIHDHIIRILIFHYPDCSVHGGNIFWSVLYVYKTAIHPA